MKYRYAIAISFVFALSGCGTTYMNARQDVNNNGPEKREAQAQANLAQLEKEQHLLSLEEARVSAEREDIDLQSGAAKGELADLNKRLSHTRAATAAQKEEAKKLTKRYHELERDLSKPVPSTEPTDAQKAELDNSKQKLDQLREQISSLQSGLK